MPWHERDYYRDQTMTGGLGAIFRGKSVVLWLIVINVVVFVLELIFSGAARIPSWAQPVAIGNFNVDQTFIHYQLWRLITYQFLHGGWRHIIFNMLVLYFFGPMLEQWLGSRRFLAFYLLCGVSGAVVMSALAYVPGLLPSGPATSIIGASGAIFGVLVADAVLFPHQKMLLFGVIPMTMRTIAVIALAFAILQVLAGSHNAAGEACHLGGAVLGFILIKTPRSLDWADGLRGRSAGLPGWSGKRLKQKFADRQRLQQQHEEENVDRILDKVKQHGLQSLTRREKKTLNRATERQRHSR